MTEVNEIVSTASNLLGTQLSDPVDLGGSDRSVVLRARRADGGTVIVKAYDRERADALRCFTAEAAGLAFSGTGPGLVAADRDLAMTVMPDLGTWPSLADVLLGDDPDKATATLHEWARAYGRMAHDSLDRGAELDRLLDVYATGEPAENDARWIDEMVPAVRKAVADAGITAPDGWDEDLAALAALRELGPRVFSPGDICPDNNLLTDQGFRVIDFEGAGYHSAYLDAAYVTMPFATCWCVYRLPEGVAESVLGTYWREITGAAPTEADRAGIRLAQAAWTLDMGRYLLPNTAAGDRPMHRTRKVASQREILRYRMRSLRDVLAVHGELPAIRKVCEDVLAYGDGWGTAELGLYPAYR